MVIVGESFVGKTCLVQRWARQEFESATTPTTGVEVHTRHIEVPLFFILNCDIVFRHLKKKKN